ncbi:MAG: hypothetical protein ACRDTR_03415, partial [Rubrobacter sp.]
MNSWTNRSGRIWLLAAIALASLAFAVAIIFARTEAPSEGSSGAQPGVAARTPSTSEASARLRSAVTVGGIMEHERRFQAIADENGGNRAAGTPGYDASAGYVAGELREAGYDVTVQSFELPFYEEVGEARLERVGPTGAEYV